jgi:hypothetical protein
MRENPQEAKNLFDNGHESISRVLVADFKDGKRDEYLGAPYWVYDDNDMAYCEALPEAPIEDDIESLDGSVRTAISDDHFFDEEHQHPNQRSQLPLESLSPPPPWPMTPPPIPFGQVVTRAGRIVNLPERYGFEDQGPEVTMLDAPPRSLTPENQPLEGLEGSQWAKLSVLLIDERKSYRQAKVSP